MAISEATYQRYVMGCKQFEAFFGSYCRPRALDNFCRIMRLAYCWPAFIVGLRLTMMTVTVGVPVVLLILAFKITVIGIIGLAGVLGVVFGICYGIKIMADRHKARKRKEDYEPAWIWQTFSKGYEKVCPLENLTKLMKVKEQKNDD